MTRIPPDHQAEVAALYVEYRDGMIVFAARLLRHQRSLAHDVVQDTFQAAALRWQELREFDRSGQRAWLYRVLKNKVFDHWGTLRRFVDLADGFPVHPAPDTQLVVASNLLVDKCWKIIDEMPQVRRQVALLRWQGEWTAREIGLHLGITPVTVRVHLMNARNTLIRSLGAEISGVEEAE